MALTRRSVLLALPLYAGALIACASATRRSQNGSGYWEIAVRSPVSRPKATLLVFMPETVQTKEVWTGLSDELSKDFRLVAVRVENADSASTIAEGMRRYQPSAVVLMNNPTVSAYRDFQAASGLREYPPAVVVMSSFLDSQSSRIGASTGISYEVPLITAMTNLRKIVAMPTERVGVLVRPSLTRFVNRQIQLARREQITVLTEPVSNNSNSSEIKRALRRLKKSAQVIWVLNDDRMLTPELIADGWLPGLNERPWLPTIVGAASLVSPSQSFGTFAVLPDHTALGTQAASILFDIADNGWSLSGNSDIQLPLSTTTTIDLTQVRERFSLRQEALQQIDRIME
jgi:hypothetical protein